MCSAVPPGGALPTPPSSAPAPPSSALAPPSYAPAPPSYALAPPHPLPPAVGWLTQPALPITSCQVGPGWQGAMWAALLLAVSLLILFAPIMSSKPL